MTENTIYQDALADIGDRLPPLPDVKDLRAFTTIDELRMWRNVAREKIAAINVQLAAKGETDPETLAWRRTALVAKGHAERRSAVINGRLAELQAAVVPTQPRASSHAAVKAFKTLKDYMAQCADLVNAVGQVLNVTDVNEDMSEELEAAAWERLEIVSTNRPLR